MRRWKARWKDRNAAWLRDLPMVERQNRIARHVIQVFLFGDPGEEIRCALATAKLENPEWTFSLFSNEKVEAFIREHYGVGVLSRYRAIGHEYGAARADLFRYLYIYRFGGVYIDIKSGFTTFLSEAVSGDEGFILGQWRNDPGSVYEKFGMHAELADITGGEFQNFHVIGAAGHPFLRAAIAAVLANIDEYSPWRFSVGRTGVLRVTGPIAYTRAIYPLLSRYPHKLVVGEDKIHLSYSVHRNPLATKRAHYSTLRGPVVPMKGVRGLSFMVFSAAFRIKKAIEAWRGE